MDLIVAGKAIILGIIEGLTEFLPISSTGHLIVASALLRFDDDLFEVVIQLGAILAVCWVYRERLRPVVVHARTDAHAQRFLWTLLLAFIPAAIFGFFLHGIVKRYLFSPWVVANALAIGGLIILWIERRPHAERHRDAERLPWRTALGVGMCQVLALIPGVSRSGASIMGGVLLGVERKAATDFSFFLAIPTMFAATGYDLFKHRHQLGDGRLGVIALGTAVAFASALVVIRWLLRYVASHDFKLFGWYRIIAGVVLAVLLLTKVIPS